MQWILVVLLLVLLAFLILDPKPRGPAHRSGRLCDYVAAGSVYEDIPTALRRGIRLVELHVYSDERDQPVVALSPQRDIAEDNVSFEQCCVDLVNDGFPSEFPLIVSLVPHTQKTVVWDRVAEHIKTTLRHHLVPDKNIQSAPLGSLANKLILVSGGPIGGTALEPLVNLNWNDSEFRRLSYVQAQHPRDPKELTAFNQDFITIVGPDSDLKSHTQHPRQPLAFGCQWNLYLHDPPGFTPKPFLTR